MKTRSGITLLEISLTIFLLSFLLASLFKLNSGRMAALQAVRSNTIALFSLESAKNKLLLMNESGNHGLAGNEPYDFLPRKNWHFRWYSDNGLATIGLIDSRSPQKRTYITQVRLKK